jgi:hypothetical protein
MTVRELYEYLGGLPYNSQHWDDEVVIPLDYPSMGSRISEPILRTNFGFDWDSSKCFIVTEAKLVKSFKAPGTGEPLEVIELKNLTKPSNPKDKSVGETS